MKPPQIPLRFFRWFCHPKLRNHIEGDLMELYEERVKEFGKIKADIKFIIDVLLLFRQGIIKPTEGYKNLNTYGMYKSYFKIGWRSLLKNKGYSYINIVGLTMGMAVTLLIGIWVFDEVSFNHYHKNYNRIAEVYEHKITNNGIATVLSVPMPLASVLKSSYKEDFKKVVSMWFESNHILTLGEKKISRNGTFMSKGGLEMFSFEMTKGSWQSLDDPSSIVLSESTALALFGATDPINQLLRVDNLLDVKVTGVFKDLPFNSRFRSLEFISSWDLWVSSNAWMKADENNWNSDVLTFVEIESATSFDALTNKIKNIKYNNLPKEQAAKENPQLFLHPMGRWHLYSEWKDGKESGGRIQIVWLFGIIGSFVLILACINFMNLSTAQSEMRAKEVGIRKSIGSARTQLIGQFFVETFLIVFLAFAMAIGLASISLPWFNQLAEKEMTMPWTNSTFILVALGFVLFTSILAGSYPALFLSSFQPVKVLKGTFKIGRFANVPRQVLVVIQFSVSVALIIGTLAVWRQIQFAKNRPVGYTREGLIMVRKTSPDFEGKTEALRHKLMEADAIEALAESASPATETWFTNNNFIWKEKDPNLKIDFACVPVTQDFGKTVGWQFLRGRDYSREHSTDSSAMILNETAVKAMGLADPLNEEITWKGKKFKVIGVIQDMIVDSPYDPVKQTIYFVNYNGNVWLNMRLNPSLSTHEAIARVENIFRSVLPAVPFEFKFIDQEFEKKFASEERIGKLATVFAVLAIFISCLGLFGLASFVAQQRTKEIGVRKVMGASVFNLWKMLSKDFIILVGISIFISTPIAYYMMSRWLNGFQYRTELTWWIFTSAGFGAIVITLLTVSYQSIKAALMNPVNSLKSE
jgi:putative ABC transport system permease protein